MTTPSQAEKFKKHGRIVIIKVVPAQFGKSYDRARTMGGVRSWCIKNLQSQYEIFMTRHQAWSKDTAYLNITCTTKEDEDRVRDFFGPI